MDIKSARDYLKKIVPDGYLFENNNGSWKVDNRGISSFDLGNLTTAGWYWTGGEDEILGFIIRIAHSQILNNFLNQMEHIDFNKIKPILIKSAKTADGLYMLSGDNRLWHFGEGGESEYFFDDEEDWLVEQGIPKNKIEDFYDYFWTYSTDCLDYDKFEREYKKIYINDITKLINSSHSFDDFISGIKDEYESWNEASSDWQREQLMSEESRLLKKFKKEKLKD